MSDDPTVSGLPEPSVDRVANMWLSASEHAYDSMLAANRAALAVFGLAEDTREEPVTEAVAYADPAWTTDRSVASPGRVSVGDRVEFSKAFTEADIEQFAGVSGDTNRLHLDENFAGETRFEDRIVHGTLVMGLVSAALARLPGVTIYLSQDQRFLKPARIGDELVAVCEVVEDLGDGTYRLTTGVYGDTDEQLIEGEAVVLIDDLPEDAA